MASTAVEINNTQNAIVTILKQFPILLNKSQLPIVKEEKTKALQTVCIKLEEGLGRKFTPQQVKRKIQNMKTEVNMKTELNATGNQKIQLKGWEEEFLQLLNGESNPNISRIPGPLMESGSNNVIKTDNHQVDIDMKIKEEPNGSSAQVKSECGGFETIFISSHFEKKCSSDCETDCNEIYNTVKIKEEPCWSESTSHEIKQEMEMPSPDADIKEPALDTEVITGDVAAEDTSRLNTESFCRNKLAVSCFYANKISDGNTWKDSDTVVDETSCFLTPGQKQIPLESVSTFRKHKLLQEGEKLPTCEAFKKNGTRLSNLNEYKLIHDGKRHYTCEICDKSFTLASTLKEHKFIHEGIRTHVCEVCNKAFTQLSQLKEHKLIHAGIKPHTCKLCKKSFTHASSMRKHKLIHEGKKSHTCEVCNKSFIEPWKLKRHKLMHEGIKPYACEMCNKGFTHMSYLRNHKITHESKNVTNLKYITKDVLKGKP